MAFETSYNTSQEDAQAYLNAFMNSKNRLNILDRAIENARNGIVITDPNLPQNPIVYANKAFIQMTGFSLNEILGRNCRFLQGSDHDQPGLEEVRTAIREAKPCMTLLKNYKKDGTLFWNELSIAPVFDSDGTLINFIGVQYDVTARKEAERRVSEFYSMVSHELRTPLSSIRASLELVDDGSAGSVSTQASRLVHIALMNSQRLLRLVNDILDLKRVEAGKLGLNLAMVEPRQLVSEVADSLAELSRESSVKLTHQIAKEKPFCADPLRIAQVLTNLVANAIKFSPANAEVLINVEHDASGIKFSVTDKGKGIAESDMEKLFQKFQQLDSSDTREHMGSGLGLAIAKLIVELHGGQIGVTSKVGAGSTFWFSVPYAPQK